MSRKSFKSSHFVKFGIPVVVFVVGGSFGLQQFTDIRYHFFGQKKFFKELEREGIPMKPKSETTLDAIFEKVEKMDTESWENKRGPRPWEENNELYKEMVERTNKLKAEGKL